jgi:hypothetical protein
MLVPRDHADENCFRLLRFGHRQNEQTTGTTIEASTSTRDHLSLDPDTTFQMPLLPKPGEHTEP